MTSQAPPYICDDHAYRSDTKPCLACEALDDAYFGPKAKHEHRWSPNFSPGSGPDNWICWDCQVTGNAVHKPGCVVIHNPSMPCVPPVDPLACYTCGAPTAGWVDEDGTYRDMTYRAERPPVDPPPVTGATLRAAIDAACSLSDPRLSEVEWDNVAAALVKRPPVDPLRWYAEGDAVCAGVEGDEHVIGLAASQKEAEDIASQHNAERPPVDEGLREAVTNEPWSFKEGTLRERLEWCRLQHQVAAETRMPVSQRTVDENVAWHWACVRWYTQMERDAAALEGDALASPAAPEDPWQPHGESGLFQHEPGAPCVVCDRGE